MSPTTSPIQFLIEAYKCFMIVNENIIENSIFNDILAKLVTTAKLATTKDITSVLTELDQGFYANHLLMGLKKAKETESIKVDCPSLFNQYVQELIDLSVDHFRDWEQTYQGKYDLKDLEEYRENLNKVYQNLF
jgi:hypothetical protein